MQGIAERVCHGALMKVIICGAGQVGWQIAKHLSGERNDVTVVDNKPELVRRASELVPDILADQRILTSIIPTGVATISRLHETRVAVEAETPTGDLAYIANDSGAEAIEGAARHVSQHTACTG